MHNLPRVPKGFDPEDALHRIFTGAASDTLLDDLKYSVRSAIIAKPGHTLVWGDLNAIEARMIQWLASPGRDTPTLAAFRRGEDPYILAAQKIGQDRFIGKVQTLACGYAGGVNALDKMARAYNLVLSEELKKKAVDAWRQFNPQVVRFWRKLERAAVDAVLTGQPISAGPITFYAIDSRRLLVRLPSGRLLTYWYPELHETEFGGHTLSVRQASSVPKVGEEWPRRSNYSGIIAENVCQAACADILRDKLEMCEDSGLDVVLHTHDEIGVECEDGEIEETEKKLAKILNSRLEWAPNFPIGSEIQSGKRYRK
jgi:DNA polymerase